jgi:RNA polymerase sigma factor (sigma-70 family)
VNVRHSVPGSLVRAAIGGDASATADILRLVWPDAFRIAWSVLGDRTVAEDAAQEACARILTAIATLRQPERFEAWFYRIVVNEARQQQRITSRETALEDGTADAGFAAEERIDLTRAIGELDPPLRTVVILHYYYALNSFEIARVVGAAPVTVRWRLHVARRRLRTALAGAPINSYVRAKGEYSDEPQAAR